jgi:hypothetical protein
VFYICMCTICLYACVVLLNCGHVDKRCVCMRALLEGNCEDTGYVLRFVLNEVFYAACACMG